MRLELSEPARDDLSLPGAKKRRSAKKYAISATRWCRSGSSAVLRGAPFSRPLSVMRGGPGETPVIPLCWCRRPMTLAALSGDAATKSKYRPGSLRRATPARGVCDGLSAEASSGWARCCMLCRKAGSGLGLDGRQGAPSERDEEAGALVLQEDVGMRGLSKRVALVTGGSRGIGKAIVLALVEAGAAVAVNTITSAARRRRETVAQAIRKNGGRAAAFGADVLASRRGGTHGRRSGRAPRRDRRAGQQRRYGSDPRPRRHHRRGLRPHDRRSTWKSAFLCTQAVLPGMRNTRRWGPDRQHLLDRSLHRFRLRQRRATPPPRPDSKG